MQTDFPIKHRNLTVPKAAFVLTRGACSRLALLRTPHFAERACVVIDLPPRMSLAYVLLSTPGRTGATLARPPPCRRVQAQYNQDKYDLPVYKKIQTCLQHLLLQFPQWGYASLLGHSYTGC